MSLQCINDFLADFKRRARSEKTLIAYSKDLEQFASTLGNDEQAIINASDAAVSVYLDGFRSEGYLDSTIRRKLSALNSFYKFLIATGRTNHNPARQITPPKQPKRSVNVLEDGDIQKLLNAITGDSLMVARDRVMLQMIVNAGVKLSEATEIKMSQLDVEAGTLTVERRHVTVKINLPTDLMADLRHYLSLRAGNSTSEFLFINKFGEAITGRSIRRHLTKYAREVGIAATRISSLLRNSYIVEQIAQDADPKELKKSLGFLGSGFDLPYRRTASKLVAIG